MRSVVIFAIWLLLASTLLAAKKPKDPKDWTGHKISEMVENHGPPSTVYDDPETKMKVYVWNTESIYSAPGRVATYDYGSGVKHQTVYPGVSRTSKQYQMFWADPDGTIAKWKSGNSK
jgi:hypothetical protein